MAKVIITAALTGNIHTRSMSPYLPVSPQELADEAVRVYEAGGAAAHVHVRNPENTMPSAELELFREVAVKVKSKCNIILTFTTGGAPGMTAAERVRVVTQLKPELSTFNTGSLNFGIFPIVDTIKEYKHDWEKQYLAGSEDVVFVNTFKMLREYGEFFTEANTKPELEIYDAGMVSNVAFMLQRGYIKKPVYIQFVLGILGGMPATANSLIFLHNSARELIGDFQWSVCAAGRAQFPMTTIALAMGGNARVGMEDNLYLSKGVLAKSNAEQVEKIVRIAKELGHEPATPDEARQILGLKGLDKVNW